MVTSSPHSSSRVAMVQTPDYQCDITHPGLIIIALLLLLLLLAQNEFSGSSHPHGTFEIRQATKPWAYM